MGIKQAGSETPLFERKCKSFVNSEISIYNSWWFSNLKFGNSVNDTAEKGLYWNIPPWGKTHSVQHTQAREIDQGKSQGPRGANCGGGRIFQFIPTRCSVLTFFQEQECIGNCTPNGRVFNFNTLTLYKKKRLYSLIDWLWPKPIQSEVETLSTKCPPGHFKAIVKTKQVDWFWGKGEEEAFCGLQLCLKDLGCSETQKVLSSPWKQGGGRRVKRRLTLSVTDIIRKEVHFFPMWNHYFFLLAQKYFKSDVGVEIVPIVRCRQGCISCGILVSGIGARGVSSEHMENMEMFSENRALVWLSENRDLVLGEPCSGPQRTVLTFVDV